MEQEGRGDGMGEGKGRGREGGGEETRHHPFTPPNPYFWIRPCESKLKCWQNPISAMLSKKDRTGNCIPGDFEKTAETHLSICHCFSCLIDYIHSFKSVRSRHWHVIHAWHDMTSFMTSLLFSTFAMRINIDIFWVCALLWYFFLVLFKWLRKLQPIYKKYVFWPTLYTALTRSPWPHQLCNLVHKFLYNKDKLLPA